MFEGWTRLPLSDRCRVVIVALAVPSAVALALAVRPAQRPPGSMFLELDSLETEAGAQLDPWGVPYEFTDGGRTESAPDVPRAEVIVESDRVLPGGVTPAGKTALVSRISRDAASPHMQGSRTAYPELRR